MPLGGLPLDDALRSVIKTNDERKPKPKAESKSTAKMSTEPEEEKGGGFLGLGDRDSFLRQALRAAVPLLATGFAPEGGAQAFNQGFFSAQQNIADLARQQEQEREARRRENAMLLFETFQNAPQNFAAMDPESLLSIAEPVAEQLNRPVEEIISMMQQQAQAAAAPSTGQLGQMAIGLAEDAPGAAQQALQMIPGFENTMIDAKENLVDLDPDEAARIKENFTDDSANQFFDAIRGGATVAEAAEMLKFKPSGKDTTLKEQMAARAVAMMNSGQEPNVLLMNAYNDYFNTAETGLSTAQITGVFTNIQGLAATLAGLDPDNPRSQEMLRNSAGVAKRVLTEIDSYQKGLDRPLVPAEIEAYIESRGQELLTKGQLEQPTGPDDATIDAASAKARAELGPEATEDEIVARTQEILSGGPDK